MEIRTLSNKTELQMGYEVLKELRKDLSLERFDLLYKQASTMDQYTLVGAFDQNKLVAVMGFRYQFDFVRGKYLYIDDLVTTETMRSKGVGAKLLKFAECHAKEAACSVVRLCAHVDNVDGQKFYDREKWFRRAIAFQKTVE